jgi:hypothetical protein
MAWPVVLSPGQVVYGHEIVGRQPDVHAVIFQLSGENPAATSDQPATTLPGRWLARAVGPVAALNVLVLWTFPLTAIATYALARYLNGSHAAALIAALVFTFAPAHLAQAAYHPYTAQTQWIPLYFLALIALVDHLSIARIAALLVACAALVLSNYEAALIGALMSPVVIGAFWAIRPDARRNLRPLIAPVIVLTAFAVVAIGLVAVARPDVFSRAHGLQFPFEEIGLYRARWWAYFTPSVDHPVIGGLAADVFGRLGVNLALVEEQIFVGYAFLALALVAVAGAAWTWRAEWRYVVAIAAIGLAAAIVSVGPPSGSCEPFSLAPACLGFRIVPMFRAYARFAGVVNLAVAIAAGAGAAMLIGYSRGGRVVAAALLVVGAFEFWPLPARAHDVLPTAAHRWLATRPDQGPSLDCYPANQADRYVPWLMKRRLSFLGTNIPTCSDPELGRKLAALGYTHAIVRGGAAASKLVTPLPAGLALAQEFPDSNVYTVATTLPPVVTVASSGFYDYEHQGDDWWRWMAPAGRWTVRNTTSAPQRIALAVDLVPIGVPRTLTITMDDGPATTVALGMAREDYTFGPWTLAPGDHELSFAADGEPTRPSDVADSRDARPLTVAFRNDRWISAP